MSSPTASAPPLYLYDGDVLRAVYQRLRDRLHQQIGIFYSAKANPNISICAVLRAMGSGIEVSSLAELVTAHKAGVPGRDVIFLGPGKSPEELRACCEYGIHAIACESLDELAALDALRPAPDTRVLLRINPSFVAAGSRLSMGGKPRQFSIDQEILLRSGAIIRNTHGILAAAEELSGELGFPLETVDVGGGLGVAYFDDEKDLDLDVMAEGVNGAVASFLRTHPGTRVITELGRYLAALAGMYVVRARYVRQSRGEQFIVADGGTNHHMAAVGIGSFVKRNFPIRLLTGRGGPADRIYTITGPLCTPNDVIGKRVPLPEVRPGDLIGVERSGAYGPSASPVLFLSHGHPAEVLVLDGVPHLVRSRDTVLDLLARQHLVPV